MVARTEAELGPVSILVNNAGASSPATLESYDPAAIARMRRVNVDGVIHTIRAVAPGVQERGQRIHSTDIERNRTGASNTALWLQLGGPKRASVTTTDYDPINARILLLHCVHSSDKGREDDQF
jgi:NAD(P)-dependent dehydrogenase (short-subunit alcohol dehydrogenase family)